MGRTAKHDWRKLFLEFKASGNKNVAAFAKKNGIDADRMRKEFRKFDTEKQGKTRQKKEVDQGKKIRQKEEGKKKAEKKEENNAWTVPENFMTPKMQQFVLEYLIDLNGTQAAIRAGYSQKTAYSIANELLQKPVVKAALDKAMEARAIRTGITADLVLMQLAKIAFANLNDFVEFGHDVFDVEGEESGPAVKIMKSFVKVKPSKQVDGSVLSEVSETVNGIRVKQHDKMKALELLGKHHGLFSDRVQQRIAEEMLDIARQRLELDKKKSSDPDGESENGNIDKLMAILGGGESD